MVGGGKGQIVLQEFSEFSSEGGCELGASVGYYLVVEAEVDVYFVEKECCYSFGIDVFLRRA